MKKKLLNVAVCQLSSIDDIPSNLNQIEEKLNEVFSETNADLVCFPENSIYLRVKEGTSVPQLELNHFAFTFLSQQARKNKTHIHIGSVPLLEHGKTWNASVLVDPKGDVSIPYRKIHLFDVDVQGHQPQRESDVFAPGEKTSSIEVHGWKIGQSICYDIRFSELFYRYAREQVDAIMIPAAFLVGTGKAHWQTLIRARAIESQAYVIAAAQGGHHKGLNGGTRNTYGHSMLVDPWGIVLGELEENPGIVHAGLSKDRIDEVRAQIPMNKHRRL